MSGVYGILCKKEDSDFIKSSLLRVSKWNLAYGEDGNWEETTSYAGFGTCYEHITTSPVNDSPLIFEDKYISVIDAIIYNRSEIIEKYSYSQGISDEYLIFRFVLDHGYDALAEINGDFCGAVLDTDKKEIVLFRDHIGVRPLFYYKHKDFVAFSSDIRGLIALPEVSGAINPDWLYKKIGGFDTSDNVLTEVEGIFEVRPASFLTFSRGTSKLTCSEKVYWKIGSKKIRLESEQAYCDRLKELISDSVKRRIDVFPGKIGAELSGGLDSGVIDILINRFGREGIYYSWSFSPEDLPMVPNDERQVIADICEQENIVCNYGKASYDVGPESNVGISHSKIGLDIDLQKDSSINYAYPLYLNTEIITDTSQFVRSHGGRVVFSGHGGDEGVSHRTNAYEMFYHHEYKEFFKYLWGVSSAYKPRLLKTLKSVYYYLRRGGKNTRTPFNAGDGAPEILKSSFSDVYKNKKQPVLTFNFDTVRYVNSGNTQIRPKVAALLGAYSGARYIFPYLDYRVLDYAVSIPRHLYIKNGQGRYIYRQTFKDIMPKSLLEVDYKNNPSEAQLDEQEEKRDWFGRLKPIKEMLARELDREFWKDYLDFEAIDKWINSEKPSDGEKTHYVNVSRRLWDCYRYQNMVKVIKDWAQKQSI